MFLALKEMRRAWVRFGLLIAAIGLLVFLILFQQALQSGLVTSFVGAIRNQSAPVLVYSVDGQRVLQGSVITPELEQVVRATPDIADIGYIGQGTFTVIAAGESADATIIGYEREGVGSPRFLTAGRLPEQPGEAVASEADADDGFDVGDTIVVEPGGLELTVVGLAPDAQLSVDAHVVRRATTPTSPPSQPATPVVAPRSRTRSRSCRPRAPHRPNLPPRSTPAATTSTR